MSPALTAGPVFATKLASAGVRACGPLRALAFACGRLREIRPTGHSAPRMSPESGCARLSSLISLRRAPRRPDPTCLGCSRVEDRRSLRPGLPGARRSEIKGEPWAQPRAEDIRGGGRPAALAGATHERSGTNVRNGPSSDCRATSAFAAPRVACSTQGH